MKFCENKKKIKIKLNFVQILYCKKNIFIINDYLNIRDRIN
jgi:hypothetical protein